MRHLAFAATLVLGTASARAAEPPALALAGGGLALSRLPAVLDDEDVAPHLRTGLTTVFLFTVEGRGTPAQKGAAQVAVRYDLWDEVYRLTLSPAPAAGQRDAASLLNVPAAGGSDKALADWWRAATLSVAPATGHWRAPLGRAKVTLQVLPFSQAEQRDAQEWLLRSFRGGVPPSAPTARAPRGGSGNERPAADAPMREFYGAMLASSIGRRSLTSWSWTVAVEGDGR